MVGKLKHIKTEAVHLFYSKKDTILIIFIVASYDDYLGNSKLQ